MNFINRSYIHFISPVIAVTIGLASVFSGRNVVRAGSDPSMVWAIDTPLISIFMLQIVTFSIVAICLARILYVIKSKSYFSNDALMLVFAYLAYFVANALLNGVFGTKPFINHHSIYALLVMCAVFVEPDHSLDKYLHTAKWGILALLSASLMTAITLPDLAIQRGYDGLIPVIDIRLWGLGSHPNSLASLALVFLLVVCFQPFHWRWMQHCAFTIASAVLILAQSKTILLAAIVCFAVISFYNFKHRPGSRKGILIISLITFLLACIIGIFLFSDTLGVFAQWSATSDSEITTSLSGRDKIWEVAIAEWKKNILFGYGPAMWDEEFRTYINMNFAFSAHNQFLQSLAGAGILGLITLTTYLITMLRFAVRSAEKTKGLTLAIFLLLFLRCFTETPLALGTIINSDFMIQILFIQLLIFSTQQTKCTSNSYAVDTSISDNSINIRAI